KAGCFHQVSSIAAAGLYPGTFTEDMFEEAEGLDHPYFATKHESEGLVRAEKRMKWRIYRPAMVVGHSLTGEMDKVDGPYYFFDLLKSLSKYTPRGIPMLMSKAGLLNIVPVDYVVDAMDNLAHRPGLDRRCFFLTEPEGTRVGDLLKTFMRVSGGPALIPMDLPSVDNATELTAKAVAKIPGVKSISDKVVSKLGIPPQIMAYLNYPTRFDSAHTRELLAEDGIVCPSLTEYADIIWDYWDQYLREGSTSITGEVDSLFKKYVGKAKLKALRKVVDGQVVVVTGATSGIGKECALRLARAGATVILVARTIEKLDQTLVEIEEKGGEAFAYSCDVSDMEDCDRLVAKVLDEHGRVD
ncbi:MAG: SDR family NAD(P)-dependent oxidoreductase, partial [Cellvibrionaceae bacterium]|nr:SDR family NAD(P)-dependent oxidoreductase [Cellvibrionaceae bacterium]